MSRSWWPKCSRAEAFPGLCAPPRDRGIHVYLFWTKEGDRYLSHTCGEVTAEDLCISAAEAVGETDSLDQMHPHRPKLNRSLVFCFVVFYPAGGTCV